MRVLKTSQKQDHLNIEKSKLPYYYKMHNSILNNLSYFFSPSEWRNTTSL